MFCNYKKLYEQEALKNLELSEKLRHTEQSLEELELFIEWLNKQCNNTNAKIIGIKKFRALDVYQYIGFLLYTKEDKNAYKENNYCIRGFRCTGKIRYTQVYYADLKQTFSENVKNIKNTIHIMSHYVDDEKLYHHGIGSAGISAIKDLAFQLHCSEIDGNRRVMGKVSDKNAEENKLKAFYNKHGFMQNPENDHIVFDMEKYEYIDVIK